MMTLMYYAKEDVKIRAVAPECFTLYLSEIEAKGLVWTLSEVFMFPIPGVVFYGYHQRGSCKQSGVEIRIPHRVQLALLLHELGHSYNNQLEIKKKGERAHTKKLTRTVLKFVRYCKRKNYWGMAGLEHSS